MYIHTTDYKFIFCDFEFDGDSPRKSDVFAQNNTFTIENLFLRLHNSSNKHQLTECMSILYKIYNEILFSTENTYIGKSATNKINFAKEYIDTNVTDPSISIAAISEMVGMCEGYFRKLFKSQYAISPSQYIISVRLKKSKELMKYPSLTLEECALQSGFSSAQYFCRMFKKSTGITPAQYRKSDSSILH